MPSVITLRYETVCCARDSLSRFEAAGSTARAEYPINSGRPVAATFYDRTRNVRPEPDDYLPVVITRWSGVECYNYSPLVYARNCDNIAITGKSTFNGQGQAWWPWTNKAAAAENWLMRSGPDKVPVEERIFGTKEDKLRPQQIQLVHGTNVLLQDYTSRNSPFWNNHLLYCQNVFVNKVRLLNPEDGPNSDGINIDSSRNVYIRGVYADVGDDAICIKSGLNEDGWRVNRPTENVVIEDCHVKKAHGGFVIGSEMSGGVRNILVRNCYYDGTDVGIRMKVRFRTFSCGALFRTATAGPVVLISDIFGSFDNLLGVAYNSNVVSQALRATFL